VSALYDAGTGFFELGADNWQPSGDPANGRIYEAQIRDGVDGPTIAPCLPELWEQYGDGSVTFGGAPTLYLVNTSISGSRMTAHSSAAQVALETPNYGQQIQVFNDSHNETNASGPAGWISPYQAWVAAFQARLPLTKPVAVLQNPHTNAWVNEAAYGQAHPVRLDELRALANAQNWGIVDLFGAFTNDGRGPTQLIQSDGLHPTQTGYDLAARVVARQVGLAV
jgi:hypothetical protein